MIRQAGRFGFKVYYGDGTRLDVLRGGAGHRSSPPGGGVSERRALLAPGAYHVGPPPAELQGYVEFAVGVLAVSKQRDAGQALVKFISSPEAAPLARAAWSPAALMGICQAQWPETRIAPTRWRVGGA
jgi:hypothetical protein